MPQDLQFYKCWAELQEPPVPLEAVEKWYNDPYKQYHCIFCGNHGNHSHFLQNTLLKPGKITPIRICSCGEYKGIEPCFQDIAHSENNNNYKEGKENAYP